MKKQDSFSIALSAVACALATVSLSLGMNAPFLIASGWLFGSVFLMLPLAKDMRWGALLAYAATCLVGLLFGGIVQFYKLFPFLVFFGLHPLANSLQEKFRINRWLALAVKEVWFIGSMCASWALLCAMSGIEPDSLPFDWIYDRAYLLIAAGGGILFIAYDFLMRRCQRLVDSVVARLDRRGKGGKKDRPAPPPEAGGADDDVFAELAPVGRDGKDPECGGGPPGEKEKK